MLHIALRDGKCRHAGGLRLRLIRPTWLSVGVPSAVLGAVAGEQVDSHVAALAVMGQALRRENFPEPVQVGAWVAVAEGCYEFSLVDEVFPGSEALEDAEPAVDPRPDTILPGR